MEAIETLLSNDDKGEWNKDANENQEDEENAKEWKEENVERIEKLRRRWTKNASRFEKTEVENEREWGWRADRGGRD